MAGQIPERRILYCAGEQARVVLDTLRRLGDVEEVLVLDDDPDRHGDQIHGNEVAGGQEVLESLDPDGHRVLVAYGAEPGVRLQIASDIRDLGFRFFSAVDPDASVSPTATIGVGTTVNAQAYVGPDVSIGDHVIVDSSVNLSHDVQVKVGATIAPNATIAGGTTVGRNTFIGTGATVRDHVEIGDEAIVGMGAVVTDDVEAGATVIGVPASAKE